MLGAFDGVVHHQPVAEMHFFMRAQAVGAEVFILRAAIDRECPAAMVEADEFLILDIIRRTGINPFCHHSPVPSFGRSEVDRRNVSRRPHEKKPHAAGKLRSNARCVGTVVI